MKLRITKEQAIILENLNNKKVLKITEEQYKEILKLEGVDESVVIPQIRDAMSKFDTKMGKDYTQNVHQMQKIKGVLHEDLFKEFVNELYGLNESGKNVYEKLIKIMEACGYVENRKLSKSLFEGDKDFAKKVITSGLAKLNECGSPYMAMETMEETFKSEKKNPFFKSFVDDWFTKGNENNMVKQYYDNGEYWLAWQIIRRLGDVGKSPQNPQDMEVVNISEIDGEESNGVVGLDILNYPPFSNLPETRAETGDYTTRMEPTLPSIGTPDANVVIFSKQDFVEREFQGPKMMHRVSGYIDLFKEKFGEEPIFINIKDLGRRGSADIANEKFRQWRDGGIASKKAWMDAERNDGRTSGLDELEIDESGTISTSSGQYTTGSSFLEPMENESKIYEALNTLKKKVIKENSIDPNKRLENARNSAGLTLNMDGGYSMSVVDTMSNEDMLNKLKEIYKLYQGKDIKFVMDELQSAMANVGGDFIKENDEMYDYIADELGLTSDEFDEALNNSMAELDIIERIMHSNSYTREEALSIITDILKLDRKPNQLEEVTSTVTAGNYGYDTPGFEKSKFMGTAGKKGKAPVNTKKKTPIWPGGKIVGESATDKTQWAGGAFVEFDDCTKLNNNKEAQKGGCSTGAADNVVKLKKTAGNVNAPSLGKKQ